MNTNTDVGKRWRRFLIDVMVVAFGASLGVAAFLILYGLVVLILAK